MKIIPWLVLILFSCTGASCPEKEVITVVKEVKVPVPIKCKTEIPMKPILDQMRKDAVSKGLYAKGMWLMTEDEANRQYAKLVEAALMACAEQK